jgi:surface antigen
VCAGLLLLLPALLLGCGPKATIGGLTGSAIGDALDQRDKELAMKAAQQSLEGQRSGSTKSWKNPDSGNSGTLTPTRTYQDGSGRYCREYRQTVTVGGKSEEAFGTPCRQPDGNWKVLK